MTDHFQLVVLCVTVQVIVERNRINCPKCKRNYKLSGGGDVNSFPTNTFVLNIIQLRMTKGQGSCFNLITCSIFVMTNSIMQLLVCFLQHFIKVKLLIWWPYCYQQKKGHEGSSRLASRSQILLKPSGD